MVRPWATPALEPLCCIDGGSGNMSRDGEHFVHLVDNYMLVSACTAAVSIFISALTFSCFVYRRAKYRSLMVVGAHRAVGGGYGAMSRITANDSNTSHCSDGSAVTTAPSAQQRHFALHMRISLAIAHQTGFGRAQSILLWLLLCDFLAVFFVLIRGAVWYSGVLNTRIDQIEPANSSNLPPSFDEARFIGFEIFCISTSFSIQFFYSAGFGWAIVYAYDTVRLFEYRRVLVAVYHSICWITACVLCGIGLCLLYLPDLKMCFDNISHTLPHLLATTLPLITALIAVPILTYSAVASCERRLLMMSSEFQSGERRDFESIRLQLRLTASTLFICWVPNLVYWLIHIVQVILVNSKASWNHDALTSALVVTWFITAVMNPLQAALNMLVYSGAVNYTIRHGKACLAAWRGSLSTPRYRDYERLPGSASWSESVSGASTRVDAGLARTTEQTTVRRVVHDLDEYFAEPH